MWEPLKDVTAPEAYTKVVASLEEWLSYQRLRQGLVVVNGTITMGLLEDLQRWLMNIPADTEKITVLLTTEGGDVDAAFGIYDLLKMTATQKPVIICAVGFCYSAGMLVLQAGTERWSLPNTSFMLHEALSFGMGKISELESDVKFMRQMEERFWSLVIERSKVTRYQVKKKTKGRNWWLTAEEAYKWRFIDAIVSSLPSSEVNRA